MMGNPSVSLDLFVGSVEGWLDVFWYPESKYIIQRRGTINRARDRFGDGKTRKGAARANQSQWKRSILEKIPFNFMLLTGVDRYSCDKRGIIIRESKTLSLKLFCINKTVN